ncbi:MAG: hypothetical protein ACK4P1_11010, partial [Aggregatilineales bacterium]
MKLLIVASSLDLRQPFSATPAWWQLLKGLYEIGVDVLATTYQGPAIETLWWRALPNPVRAQGDAFKAVRALLKRSIGKEKPIETARGGETRTERLQREVAQRVIMPRWRAFMDRTFKAHPDIDAA